jgi:predicted dehydrogenase
LSNKLKVLLIGLGGIGCKYDYPKLVDSPYSLIGNSKTHLSAIRNSGTTLIGGIDPDENSRNLFENNSLAPVWDNLENFPNEKEVDLIVISSPTSTHRDIFAEVIDRFLLKGIIIEKPFGLNAQESTYMLGLATAKGVPVRVNYSRNYSQGFQKIQEKLYNDNLVSGNVLYSQGLRQNGSHFIRLILELFGPPHSVVKNNPKDQNLNPSFLLCFNNGGYIQFTGSNSAHVRTAEITLETESHLTQIREGMKFQLSLLNKETKPVKWPTELEIVEVGNLDGGMQEIYNNLQWVKPEFYGKQVELNFLDNLCNEILDGLLLQ